MLDGSNAEAMDAARKALSHPAAGVRKAAAQVLPKTEQSFGTLQQMLKDPSLNTRLATPVSYTHLDVYKRQGAE